MISLTTPEGHWEIRYTRNQNVPGFVEGVDVRFWDNQGREYLTLERVFRLLQRIGWPPVLQRGQIGVLYHQVLPKPDLVLISLPAIELWREEDVRAWRDNCIANYNPGAA